MSELTTVERREAIADAMYARRNDTVENLAFEFDVSPRTIKNDIAILSRSHPFYTKQGRYGGGIYVSDGYLDNRRRFCDDEERELLEKLSESLTGRDAEIMNRIRKKFYRPDPETINQGF